MDLIGKKRVSAEKLAQTLSDFCQHEQPRICDPCQSFKNHHWVWRSHNLHRLIIALATSAVAAPSNVLALPACRVGPCTVSVSGPPFADGAIPVWALRWEERLG